MDRGTKPAFCHFFMILALALGLALAPSCSDEEPERPESPEADSGAEDTDASSGDAEDEPGAVETPSEPFGGGPAVPGADAPVDVESDDDWEEPDGPLESCSDLLACLSDCPVDSSECLDACHEAATDEAAVTAHALTSCVNSHGCRDEHCVMQNCGQEMEACFAP